MIPDIQYIASHPMLKVGETGFVNNQLDIASSYTNSKSNYKQESCDNNRYTAG